MSKCYMVEPYDKSHQGDGRLIGLSWFKGHLAIHYLLKPLSLALNVSLCFIRAGPELRSYVYDHELHMFVV